MTRADPRKGHRGEEEALAQVVLIEGAAILTDDREAAAFAERRGIRAYTSSRLARMIARAETGDS